jgi:vancomycin resistance protein YoaR
MKTLLFGLGLSLLLSATNAPTSPSAPNELLQTGLSIEVNGQTYTFPVQEKDLTERGLTPAFLNYVLSTLHSLVDITPQNIRITAADSTKVSKVTQEGTIKDGQKIVDFLTRPQIAWALFQKTNIANAFLEKVPGEILNESGVELGPLELLGEGKSTFWGSSPEREFNIRKALNEKMNGILIPPGAEFSYVDALGPIEYGGWKRALVIVNGTEVEPAPAGGVCQVSTTVYRAALDAALTVTEQRSHSLYVIYYNDYGDGLDATVFPGEQDLKFVNNTPNYLLMVAQEEGYYESTIRFYGQSDGRSTTLIGPYTASNETDETLANVGKLGIGEIVWKYLIRNSSGSEETRWLRSSYLSKANQHKEAASELTLE